MGGSLRARRILVTTLPTNDLGLLARGLPVAVELRERGHEVVFASPAAAPRRVVDEAGFRNEVPRHALYALIDVDRRWPACCASCSPAPGARRSPDGAVPARGGDLGTPSPCAWHPRGARTDHAGAVMGMLDQRFVRANVLAYQRLVDEVRPDLVLDLWNPLAVMAARCRAVPVATLIQADAHPASDGFGWWTPRPRGLPDPVPDVNEVAAEVGLPAVERVAEWCVGDVTLVTGTPRTDPLPRMDVTYVGALLWEQPADRLPPAVQPLRADWQVVWVYSGNPSYGGHAVRWTRWSSWRPAWRRSTGRGSRCCSPRDTTSCEAPAATAGRVPPRAVGAGAADGRTQRPAPAPRGLGQLPDRLLDRHPGGGLPTFSERESNARRLAALGAGELVPVAAETDHVKTVDEHQRAAPYAGCSTTRAMPPGRPRSGRTCGPTAVRLPPPTASRRWPRPADGGRVQPPAVRPPTGGRAAHPRPPGCCCPGGPGGPSLASKP